MLFVQGHILGSTSFLSDSIPRVFSMESLLSPSFPSVSVTLCKDKTILELSLAHQTEYTIIRIHQIELQSNFKDITPVMYHYITDPSRELTRVMLEVLHSDSEFLYSITFSIK